MAGSMFTVLLSLAIAIAHLKSAESLLTFTSPRDVGTAVTDSRTLGNSDILVSEACLGTMTFGVQNDREDAFAQLDLARSKGVNFIDTAELYPVPLFAPEWQAGKTEEILGDYINKIGPNQRDELVVATKVAGYMAQSPIAAARSSNTGSNPLPDCRLDAASVRAACGASLRRLQTDRIDLLQLHWPDRYTPLWGQMIFDQTKVRNDAVSIEETASALRDLIDEGKVRTIGLSNETPFGVCEWARVTEKLGIRDKLVSIQNSYSLLDRRFDSDLAEACSNHNLGLLPYSVLAGGLLTGKYRPNAPTASKSSRFVAYPEYMRRWSPVSASKSTLRAVENYAQIASDAGLTPAQLAIAFVRSRNFVADNGSIIIGATTANQLEANLANFDKPVVLDQDVLDSIDEIHMRCRDPCCSL